MLRLDYKKWRHDLDNAKTANEKTMLFSIRAHIKGKLHRHRASLTWETLQAWGKLPAEEARLVAVAGGSMTVPVDAADQERFVDDRWMNYLAIPADGTIFVGPSEPGSYKFGGCERFDCSCRPYTPPAQKEVKVPFYKKAWLFITGQLF